MDIIINGAREPSDDFWQMSGVLESTKWTHNPFIVLQESDKGNIEVNIVEKLTDVLEYPDECIVLKQWPGKWRSDFFRLTAGALRQKAATYKGK